MGFLLRKYISLIYVSITFVYRKFIEIVNIHSIKIKAQELLFRIWNRITQREEAEQLCRRTFWWLKLIHAEQKGAKNENCNTCWRVTGAAMSVPTPLLTWTHAQFPAAQINQIRQAKRTGMICLRRPAFIFLSPGCHLKAAVYCVSYCGKVVISWSVFLIVYNRGKMGSLSVCDLLMGQLFPIIWSEQVRLCQCDEMNAITTRYMYSKSFKRCLLSLPVCGVSRPICVDILWNRRRLQRRFYFMQLSATLWCTKMKEVKNIRHTTM